MRLTRATLAPLLFASLALGLAARSAAREAQGVSAEAQHLASSADDYAATLAGRREALRLLEEAARLHSEAGQGREAARALNRAGRLRLLLSEPRAALEAHRRALSLLARAPDATAEADALGGLGETHLHLQQLEEAEQSLRRALAVSGRADYARGRAQALITLSLVQIYKDQTLAMATAEEALALWQSLGDRRGLALAHSQVGRCHFAQNRLVESAQNYERALQLSRESGDRPGEAGALIMLGFVEYRRGEWRANIALLTQAQALIDEEAEPDKMGQIAAGLAEAFNEAGLPEDGLAHYGRALEYYRRTQDPHLVWYAVWGLGCTHLLLGDHPAAFRELRRSLEGVKKDGLEAAQTYHYLGRTHLAAGDAPAALRHFRSALDIYERRNNPDWAARARGLMGQAYARAGRVEAARASYTQALETFGRLSDRVNEAAVAYAVGRLELSAGNLDAAEKYLSLSIEATEGVRRDSTSSDLTAAFSATVHERYEAYVELLMRRHAAEPERGFDVLAFENVERARARSLAELLRATETSLVPGLDPKLAERERSLRQALRAREDDRMALLRGKYERPALEALDADLARLRAEYAGVEDAIRALHPSYGQIARPAGWNLERIRQQVVVGDETVLLEYGLGAERGYVWAVTREGLRSYELPPRALVERAAGRVYALLSGARRERGTEREVEEAARELSRMILAPAAASLRGRSRVIVVADGGLNYVPFQVLPAPADGEPLVAGHEVVNAPSASVLGQLREEAGRRLPPARTLVAFGDPVFESNYALRKSAAGGRIELAELRKMEAARFGKHLRDIDVEGDALDPSTAEPLTYAGPELRNLREVSADSLVAADFDATRERLQQTDLSGFAIVHFATHGLLDPRQPERSGLLLSTVDRDGRTHGGFVGLRDVYSLRAPVGLVVLSACRTALGKEVRGEGMIGLTRGFLYAGASGVVSSLWKVDDEATSELMRRFYENMLRDGMTPSAALRAAQNSIRREPHWRSPFYWAAFTLQGEYRQVLRPARSSGWKAYTKILVSGGVVLSLAALAAWWLRRRRASALA
jgi:CHAT domain-containing protein/predicted negative regulator of RcsB-dependent stress response